MFVLEGTISQFVISETGDVIHIVYTDADTIQKLCEYNQQHIIDGELLEVEAGVEPPSSDEEE